MTNKIINIFSIIFNTFFIFLLFPCLIIVRAEELSPSKGRLIMGFYANSIPDVASRSDVEVSLNFWAKELLMEQAKTINLEIIESRAVLYDNFDELYAAVQKGELDLVVAPPILFSKYFKRDELTDGFVAMLQDRKKDGVLLVARADQHIKSVKDLQNSRLMILSNDEMVDIFTNSLFMKNFNKNYTDVVSSVDMQNKSSRIVLDIFFNRADAGVVYRSVYDVMVELNPDITNKVVILEEFPIKGKNFSFFIKNYPFADQMKGHAIQSFQDHPRGKQILETFGTPDLEDCSLQELDVFDKFYQDYLQLKHNLKH